MRSHRALGSRCEKCWINPESASHLCLSRCPRWGWDPAGQKYCVHLGQASQKLDLPPQQSAHRGHTWTTAGSTLSQPPSVLVCCGRTPRDTAGWGWYICPHLDDQSVTLFLRALPRSCGLAWQMVFSAQLMLLVFIRGPHGVLRQPLNKVMKPLNEGAVWEGEVP